MNHRGRKIIIWSILIILTLGFIWGNSMLAAEQSSAISNTVKGWIDKVAEIFFPGRAAAVAASGDGLLRKIAHFTEFTVLGIELTMLLYRVLVNSAVLPLFCGILAALADETIQLFSGGRTSKVTDVWIDFGGVIVGFLLVLLFSRIRQHRSSRHRSSRTRRGKRRRRR